jgi:hypothetical protein
VLIGWRGLGVKLPEIGNAAAMQEYTDSYNKAISDCTAKLEQIKSDPKLKSAVSTAQKHAEHVREMKQIVEAQDQCEHALKSIKPPPGFANFHAAMLEYSQDLGHKYRELEASVKHKDVPDLNVDLKKMGQSVDNAASNVDRQLAQIPHYEQGKKQIVDLWSQFKKQLDEDLPPISN